MFDEDVPDGWQAAHRQGPGRLGFLAGWGWIVRGWSHYQANPVAWSLAVACWFLLILVLQLPVGFAASLPIMLPTLANLLGIFMPFVLIGGLMLGCRAQEEGADFTVRHLFAGFSQHLGGLLMIALIYMAILMSWVMVSTLLFFMLAGQDIRIESVELLATQDILLSLAFVLLVSLAIICLFMAVIFAPALVTLDGVGAWRAIRLSFRGSMANLMPLTLHGLVGVILLVLGSIPAGLGLLVVIPVLIASVYAAYDEIFHREEAG